MKRFLWTMLLMTTLLFCAFSGPALADLVLPAGTKVIEAEAFMDNPATTDVVLNDGLERIESKAFSGCALNSVNLPASLEYIADDAFDWSADTTVTAEKGTYAWRWAIDHHFLMDVSVRATGTDTYEISWEPVTGFTGNYYVSVGTEDYEYLTAYRVQNGNSATMRLDIDTKYTFMVDYQLDDGTWIRSEFVSADPLPTIQAPLNPAASMLNDTTALVTWDPIPGVEGYRIYFSRSPELTGSTWYWSTLGDDEGLDLSAASLELPLPGRDEPLAHDAVAEGDYWYFWICADNGNGPNRRAFTETSVTPYLRPTGTYLYPSNTDYYYIRWDKMPNATGYRIYFSESSEVSLSSAYQEYGAENDYTFFVVNPGEQRYFAMTALYGDEESRLTGVMTGTLPEPMPAPQNPQVESVSAEGVAHLVWDAVPGAENYRLFISKDPEYDQNAWHIYTGSAQPVYDFDLSGYADEGETVYFWITVQTDKGPGYPSERISCVLNENTVVAKGTWGELTWALDQSGCLSIAGAGPMNNFSSSSSSNVAWKTYKTQIFQVQIGEGVTSIGSYAFRYCTSLTSVTIPDSVTSIGSDAFEDCSSLTSVTIPDSVTSIGSYAFRNCSSLTSITIPDSVTSIGSSAFYNCSSLTSVTIPDSVTSIGDWTFGHCSGLTSVTIPDNVTSIGYDAFYSCSSLTSVTIPDSVTSIWDVAFASCSSLTSVTIPDSVTSIGSSAFRSCSSLTSVTIPDSVTSIGSRAFSNCTSLTSIYCVNPSYAWDWCVSNGLEDKLVAWGGNPSALVLSGSLADMSPLKVGKTAGVSGEVRSSGADIGRITLTIDGYYIDGDENDRYATREFSGTKAVSLADYPEFALDASRAPLNTPGTYTVRLWAYTTESAEGVMLDEMTVTVNGWTGYVQAPKAYTYAASADEVANGFVDNADPVSVLGCENGRYQIEMILTAGGTAVRWVDRKWIGESVWTASKLTVPTITYPASDGCSVEYGDITVTWEEVTGAEHYVVSLRELDTDRLLIFHGDSGDGTESVLQATYFAPGMTYRVAVGAVPPGYDSTSELVGWCERVFTVPALVESTQAGFTGIVYELTDPDQVQQAVRYVTRARTLFPEQMLRLDEQFKDYESTPLAGCTLNVTDTDGNTAFTAVTDEQGRWNCPNLHYGQYYTFEFSKAGKTFFKGTFEMQAIGETDQAVPVYCYDSSLTSVPEQLIRIEYNGKISSLQHGLFAEYFAYMNGADRRNFMTAENKRNEGTVSNVDFSWTAGMEQLHDHALDWGNSETAHSELSVFRFQDQGTGTPVQTVNYLTERFGIKLNGYLLADLSLTGDDNYDDQVRLRVRGDDGVKLKLSRNTYDTQTAEDWANGSNRVSKPLTAAVGTVYKLEISHYSKGGAANLIFEYNVYPESDPEFQNGWKTVPSSWLYQGARTVWVSNMTEIQTLYAMREDAVSSTISNYMHKTWKDLLGDIISDKLTDPLNTFLSDTLNLKVDYHTGSYSVVKRIRENIIRSIKSKMIKRVTGYFAKVLTDKLAGDTTDKVTENNVFDVLWKVVLKELTGVDDLPDSLSDVGDAFDKYMYIVTLLENQQEMGEITNKLDEICRLLSFSDIDNRAAGYKLGPETTVDTILFMDGDTKDNIEEMQGLLDGSQDAEDVYEFAKKAYKLIQDLEKDADRARATIALICKEQGSQWFNSTISLIAQHSSGDTTGAENLSTMLNISLRGNSDAEKLSNLLEGYLPYLTGKQCAQILAANQSVSLDKLLYKELLVLTLDASKGVYKSFFDNLP